MNQKSEILYSHFYWPSFSLQSENDGKIKAIIFKMQFISRPIIILANLFANQKWLLPSHHDSVILIMQFHGKISYFHIRLPFDGDLVAKRTSQIDIKLVLRSKRAISEALASDLNEFQLPLGRCWNSFKERSNKNVNCNYKMMICKNIDGILRFRRAILYESVKQKWVIYNFKMMFCKFNALKSSYLLKYAVGKILQSR